MTEPMCRAYENIYEHDANHYESLLVLASRLVAFSLCVDLIVPTTNILDMYGIGTLSASQFLDHGSFLRHGNIHTFEIIGLATY